MSLQKKLYKERKSLWIYQIFKSFETCFSLSNVFVKSRYYKNPIEFIFNSVSSNWNVKRNTPWNLVSQKLVPPNYQ